MLFSITDSVPLRCVRLEGYLTINTNLVPEAGGLSLGEAVHAGVIGVVHEVMDS